MKKLRAVCVHIFTLVITILSSAAAYSADTAVETNNTVTVKILGINDFHGQIPHIQKQGGLHALGSHLLKAIESTPYPTFIAHGGDHIGASPAQSALLQDEPAITFLNALQHYCNNRTSAKCAVMGTAGNHEFDEGSEELLRVLQGGTHQRGPFLRKDWGGANYDTLSANVRYKKSQQLILKPYVVHEVSGVKIGFIGLTLDVTPQIVVPGIVNNLSFEPQIKATKQYAKELVTAGVQTIVLIVHDGSVMSFYGGVTQKQQTIPENSAFYRFIQGLPKEVDLVVSGHSHEFTNVYVETLSGSRVLVTQALSRGQAYADITLQISAQSGDVVNSFAEVVKTPRAYTGKLSADALGTISNLRKLVNDASDYVETLTSVYLNTYEPAQNEPKLGEFLAETHRYHVKTDIGVMNTGGVRAWLTKGKVTWGDIFAIQPFSNNLVVREYTGEQLQQLSLNSSAIWSTNVHIDEKKNIYVNGEKIAKSKQYTVAGNEYLMNTKGFSDGKLLFIRGKDIDASVEYIKQLPTPFSLSDTPD